MGNKGVPKIFGKKTMVFSIIALLLAGLGYLLGYLFGKRSQPCKKRLPEKVSIPEENRMENVGNIMMGKSYIQRKEIEQKLFKKTIKNGRSVNLVGMRKVGKSSLIYNFFEARTDEYYEENDVVVAKILAKTCNSADMFFKYMVEAICNVSKKESDSWVYSSKVLSLNEKIKSGNLEKDGPFTLYEFFKTINSHKKRVICVVDDFYNSSELLNNYSGFFTVLKELVKFPEKYGVSFVFVSEIPIKDLDFIGDNRLYLRGFSDKEMFDYYRQSEIQLNDEERALLKCFAGGHPYWLDIILAAYKAAKESGENTDMETIFREKAKIIYPEFEAVLDSPGEDLKNKLYQIVFGPMDEKCTQIDIDTLYDYGILDDRKNPKIISGKLYEYMKMKERDVNFFPLWHDTETGMRKILKPRLKRVYSEADWEKRIADKYILKISEKTRQKMQIYFFPNDIPRKNAEPFYDKDTRKTYTMEEYSLSYCLEEAIKQKKKMKDEQEQDHGCIRPDAEITILEAIYTRGLFLLCELEYFNLNLEEIFEDHGKFKEAAYHLKKARNKYQHNNDEQLKEEYKKKTITYCKYLLECIKKARIEL
ncbi:hypothetical protein J5690_05145 [bacterium]|nr:hypothetical protein [bacterium]